MKKHLHFGAVITGLLLISSALTGQYTGSNPDVALSKPASAPDSIPGFEPSKAVDGLTETYCAVPGAAPVWFQVDLQKYHNIDGFGFFLPNPGELPLEFTCQVSEDGVDWMNLGDFTIADSGTYGFDVVQMDPIRFIRFDITSKDALASFAEVFVYGEELERPPPPAALPATDIYTTEFTANWEQLAEADGYVISVALDPGFTSFLPGYSNYWVGGWLYWHFSGLDPGTDYYYRVRAYNAAGSSTWGPAASLTTLQAAQDISFEPLTSVVYGDDAFELTGTASSGLPVSYESSDESVAVINGSTLVIVGAGTAGITASQEGNTQYLPATPVIQDLVVEKKTLTVTGAMVEQKMYDGTTAAVISGATLEGVVDGDDVSLSGADTGIFAQAEVGTAVAVETEMGMAGTDTANYAFIAPAGLTGDITPRELTVTADDQSREECADNPVFTFTYEGFAEGEDAAVLTEEPVASCIADAGSPDGTYEITVSGGSGTNYVLSHVSGTLTVTPDATPPVLAVQNITIQVEETGYVVVAASDLVTDASDNCTISDTTLSQSLFTIDDVGTVNVDVILTDVSGNQTTEVAEVTVESVVGIGSVASVPGVTFYPNPTQGIIHLEMNHFADEVKVLDMTGRTVLRKSNLDRKDVIDLSDYHNGIYLIQVRFGRETVHFNVIKN